MTFDDVCAVLVTRGDVDMSFAKDLPYGEVVIHDNSKHALDSKVYGRYVAAEQSERPLVFFMDDDVRFVGHRELLDAYEPGKIISNMYDEWIESCGYFDLALVGLGSIMDNGLWRAAFKKYEAAFPHDDRFLLDADFIFGTLTPFRRYDFGHEILDIASDETRLWQQEGQLEGKWRSIKRARSLRSCTLAILTKNEEDNIGLAIASSGPWVDSVTILDSGSMDGTRAVAQRFCDNLGISLHWYESEWEGFGKQRNCLLALAREHGDYILMMDADEELVDPGPRPELAPDAFILHYEGPVDYGQPRLLASRFPFAFDDVEVHAALDTDHATFAATAVDLTSPLIRHHGWDRAATKERIEAQVEGLRRLLDEGVDIPRHTFLLAKAYEGLGWHGDPDAFDQAIRCYKARLAVPSEDEESYYSRYRLGCLLAQHRNQFLPAAEQLLIAWENRPTRNEALRALAHYATAIADATPYPEGDLLIVHRDSYTHSPKEGR